MARCPNFSSADAAVIVEALDMGATLAEAVASAAVSPLTYRMWRRRRPEFARQVDGALARNVAARMSWVVDAARGGGYGEDYVPPNWRASVFLAQRQAASAEIARLRELTADAV